MFSMRAQLGRAGHLLHAAPARTTAATPLATEASSSAHAAGSCQCPTPPATTTSPSLLTRRGYELGSVMGRRRLEQRTAAAVTSMAAAVDRCSPLLLPPLRSADASLLPPLWPQRGGAAFSSPRSSGRPWRRGAVGAAFSSPGGVELGGGGRDFDGRLWHKAAAARAPCSLADRCLLAALLPPLSFPLRARRRGGWGGMLVRACGGWLFSPPQQAEWEPSACFPDWMASPAAGDFPPRATVKG
ncbi:unnamed protein product [Urochloa humidicola]